MSFKNIKLIDVAIIVFDDVDFLDIVGPIEVFAAATIPDDSTDIDENDLIAQLYNSISLFNTKLVSVYKQDVVNTADGTKLIPDYCIGDLDESLQFKPFIYVIPGGKGVHVIRKDMKFIKWLKNTIQDSNLSLSVCTGAYPVAQTGLLDTEDIVATHWRHIEIFQNEFPQINLANNSRYVDNGTNIITTGGVSSGIDGALRVVARLFSDEVAQRVADRIVYPWAD